MKQVSEEKFRIVSWPFGGVTATGLVDDTGYVIVAVDYKMDSNVEEGDTWLADTLYTEDIPESDWSKVRPATDVEQLKLIKACGGLAGLIKIAWEFCKINGV